MTFQAKVSQCICVFEGGENIFW